jgi:cell division protease FtsH
MKSLIYSILTILSVNGILHRNNRLMMKQTSLSATSENTIKSVLNMAPYMPSDSYSRLKSEIDAKEVDAIYLNPSMDIVVSHHPTAFNDNVGSESDSIFDYSITRINPTFSKDIIDQAYEKKIETVFLVDPTPPVKYGSGGTNEIFSLGMASIGSLIQFVSVFFILRFIALLIIRNSSPFMPKGGDGIGNMKKQSKNNGGGFFGGFGGGGNGLFGQVGNTDMEVLTNQNISLSSFAGSREIMEECTEVISFIQNNTVYKAAGAEIPRGILLEGPPGTGKTLLAKAIASEANTSFVSISGSEFVEMFVGLGASKVRDLFETARDNKPCIIFIDEIDAVGKKRNVNAMTSNDEREQTLNQLLVEMDGFGDNEDILVMAATNRRDVLDPALLRPGRFDRIIQIPLPDTESRKEILRVHSRNKVYDSNTVDFNRIAELTGGFSGAQIKNLLNEAAIFAARNMRTIITGSDLMAAFDKTYVGIGKRGESRDEVALKRVAIHEMGHALMAALFKQYFQLQKVTIQSTYTGAGGYTLFNELPNITESGLYTKDLLYKRLIITMGGKAAEHVYYGNEHISVGATQDLKQSNELAREMIGKYGMSNGNLQTFYNDPVLSSSMVTPYSQELMASFDRATIYIVNSAYSSAIDLIKSNIGVSIKIIDGLLKNQTMFSDEIYDIVDNTAIL